MSQLKAIKILVVDDEPNILQFLEIGLQNEGFEVQTAADAMNAVTLAQKFKPHLAVIDVMMPGMDGFELCRMLKKTGPIAIIMLTARDEVEDRIKGLTLRADDYMAKPQLAGDVVVGPFLIDDKRKEIRIHQRLLELTNTEYELLKYLVLNHGLVLSKTMILDKVWRYDFGGEENIVEVYVRSLRGKLNDKEHRIIRTLRGAGYRVDFS